MILASIALSSFGQGVWNTRTGLPSGQGRWGCATFSVNDIAYVCGGYTGTLDLSEVRAYDTNTDQWSSRASLPVTVRLASGFAINGKGYVACGLSNSSDLRNELWEYDPNQNTWTQKASFPAGGRYGMSCFVINGIAYFAGGNTGGGTGPYTNECWSYDPVANNWSQRQSMRAGTLRSRGILS